MLLTRCRSSVARNLIFAGHSIPKVLCWQTNGYNGRLPLITYKFGHSLQIQIWISSWIMHNTPIQKTWHQGWTFYLEPSSRLPRLSENLSGKTGHTFRAGTSSLQLFKRVHIYRIALPGHLIGSHACHNFLPAPSLACQWPRMHTRIICNNTSPHVIFWMNSHC